MRNLTFSPHPSITQHYLIIMASNLHNLKRTGLEIINDSIL